MGIVGLIVILVAFGIGGGSNLSILFDPNTALIVIVGTLGLLLFGGSSIPTMFKAVFSSTATVDELQAAIKGWRLAGVYGLISGAIGALIGMVHMMKFTEDLAAVGPGMALSSMGILHGFLLAFAIYLPLQSRLKDRLREQTVQS